ncbi:hypothetical protein N9T52_00035 [bacterium]|nr:hypothetical protein [bacterium]
MKSALKEFGTKVARPVTKGVRNWAIKRTEKRIADAQVEISALSEEELEILVREEEDKLKNRIKNVSMGAVMITLGVA